MPMIKKAFAALLTDLSKAFNCFCHDLLIEFVQHRVYGLLPSSLNLVQDCLPNFKQRIQVDCFFSSWEDLFIWSTTRLYPESSFVQYFICHMFLILETVYLTSCVDDNKTIPQKGW